MKFPKQSELEQLISKVQQQQALSTDELMAFTHLNAELATWKTDWVKVLDEVVNQIVTHGITLDQLVSRPELNDWAAPARMPSNGGLQESAAEGEKKRRQRIPNPELVIFRIQPPGAKGAATLIHRGEVPQKLGAKLQWLLDQEGELKDKLLARVDSPEAQEYLANEEGQLFLENLINWMKG